MKSAPHPARIALDAYYRFIADDGWAIASHIALSALMALFPFLIVVTSLAASALGSKALAEEVVTLLLEAWPEEVAGPIANEIRKVLTTTRGDRLFIGLLTAAYINLVFIGLAGKFTTWFHLESEPSVWISFVISMAALALIMRKG